MDIRRRYLKASVTKVAPKPTKKIYSIDLNNQWRLSETVANPDASLYDGVYESFSNYNVSNSCAKMTITLHDAETFTIYIRSYAEAYYDYVMVSQLDKDIDQNTSYLYSELVKAHTRTNQTSGSDIYSYTKVVYENIPEGEHTITVIYRKDSGANYYNDTGYLIIEKPIIEEPEEPEETIMNIDNYLTIEALEDGLSAYLSNSTCEYCVDGSGNWITLSAGSPTQSIASGHTLSFRGDNLTATNSNGIGTFSISKKCNIKGNIMSMIFGDNAANNYSLAEYPYAFSRLFTNNTNIISVSENFLPAMALSSYCYYYMFSGCSNLTNMPKLPALTGTGYCYYCMFYNCTNLTDIKEICATTLGYMSCYYMFCNCANITKAPDLLTETLTGYCYYYMFKGCSKLSYIKSRAINASASGCMSYWVQGVASTGTFVKHRSATWNWIGVGGVPSGWTIVIDSNGIPTQTFTIRDTATNTIYGPFTFEEGMTAQDFYNSAYSHGTNLVINTGYLCLSSSGWNYNTSVYSTDLLQSKEYTINTNSSSKEPM